jgi:transcription elongation factor GreA
MSANPPQALTVEGRRALEAQLRDLIARRPEVIEHITATRSEGDLAESSAYAQALDEQAPLEGRIAEVEEILRTAEVIDAPSGSGVVQFGSHVTVVDEFGEADYHIVGSPEADPGAGRISAQSPVGRALLGARAGDTVTAVTPEGPRTLTVGRVV